MQSHYAQSLLRSVPYQPNLLNTVMFLVKSSQQVAVLVVNYKGRPWMQGYLENRALFLSAFLCGAGLFILASGIIPPLNHFLELMVLPDDLRNRVLGMLLASTVGIFILDRIILAVFAPKVFYASTIKPLLSTKPKDFIPLFKTMLYVSGGLFIVPIVLSSPLLMIGAFWAYRKYKAMREQKEQEQLMKIDAQRAKQDDTSKSSNKSTLE
ncbi:hypothetical protein FOZ62_005966 [Perkinsus olseni]|uniref:Uncharacterized protein n=1 Tax=Perkinsus olseni TaxID=32597 RepID=A0A7J6S441_PEROL|nr:hypothetical protein FOZ62_005966 [Perkinsus olseni]